MSTPPRKVLLHIGWPKTGTTTLQRYVWKSLPNYRYLGKAPFIPKEEQRFFDLVYSVAYANEEKFMRMQEMLADAMYNLEIRQYGDIDPQKPAIISEEGSLSVLLKPSSHQHHGYSTASLHQIVLRLHRLEELWNVSFDILITEREPLELLHAYYAQIYHIFQRFPGLGSFQNYIAIGTSEEPRQGLGFHYLTPGKVASVFSGRFGKEHVFVINMKDLFSPGIIHLDRWHPQLPVFPVAQDHIENKRTIDADRKIAHIRPIWAPKRKFEIIPFAREVKMLYMRKFANHDKLKVVITMESQDRERFKTFMSKANGEMS